MNSKFLLILILFVLSSCSLNTINKNETSEIIALSGFKNNGFTIVYDDNLYKNELVSLKLEDRDLLIFQKNLKKGTTVKIKNNINNKSIIAKVGKNSNYPAFNNSVITKRIAFEIDLNLNEPYVEILEILNNSSFIAKKAKTFDEEKNVANKAPVESISINDLNSNDTLVNKDIKKKFSYIIKIGDFYFYDSAKLMMKRIINETEVKKIDIKTLSETNYRVFLGPFNNLNSLKNAFNDISLLNFENIEIIKND
ncbi:MAG: hypothetical protein CMD46_01470 [Gammaproteobacteria bacterium]|nr:hypothetical protein [Gammaproteobacteria bacterium]